MASGSNNLLADMTRFEQRLRDAWSLEVPCVPQHLQPYRQAWLDTLHQPYVESTQESMTRAIRQADLILVSDFHPLQRSRTGLAALLQSLPKDRPIVLGLEFLAHGTTLTVAEALRNRDIHLVTGQGLYEAYSVALEALCGSRTTIVGTWIDGTTQARDAAAADVWKRIQRKRGHFRGVFHFGDWHLAAPHLPARLQEIGAEPVVIHQSPEPIWERTGLHPSGHVYQLANQHWAWLQTPPLSLWANHLQDIQNHDADSAAEAAEHLCESASEHLAQTLGLDVPECCLSVLPADAWSEFHQELPRRLAAAFDPVIPPTVPVFHPRLPMMWSPGNLDLTHLIKGAAHCLNCSSPLQMQVGPLPELRRQVFRNLCAYLVNPFLATTDLQTLARQMTPTAQRDLAVGQVVTIGSDPKAWYQLEPAAEALLLAHLAQSAAHNMARRQDLGHADLRQFLDPALEAFDWEALMATIRAA